MQKVNGWGGKRKGAGRPNKTKTVNHMKRPLVNLKKPLHLTMRLKDGKPNLRKRHLLREFKNCLGNAKKKGLHIIHFSLQSNHIHMIAEARDNKSLSAGMKSLVGKMARTVSRGKGAVFVGRFHLKEIRDPRQMKNVLEYVLLNHAKHANLIEYIDQFSSGGIFRHWKSLLGRKFRGLIYEQVKEDGATATYLSEPTSWLCSVGWMRACG